MRDVVGKQGSPQAWGEARGGRSGSGTGVGGVGGIGSGSHRGNIPPVVASIDLFEACSSFQPTWCSTSAGLFDLFFLISGSFSIRLTFCSVFIVFLLFNFIMGYS